LPQPGLKRKTRGRIKGKRRKVSRPRATRRAVVCRCRHRRRIYHCRRRLPLRPIRRLLPSLLVHRETVKRRRDLRLRTRPAHPRRESHIRGSSWVFVLNRLPGLSYRASQTILSPRRSYARCSHFRESDSPASDRSPGHEHSHQAVSARRDIQDRGWRRCRCHFKS